MKKITLFFLLCVFVPALAQAAELRVLSKTSESWDGAKLHYPKGVPEITAIKIILKPGEEMPFHCHPFPTIGYIVSGTLIVEKLDGTNHTFNTGDTISEVVGSWHRGKNPSKTEPVELVGFYTGAKGTGTTIPYDDAHKDACKI